MLKSLSVIKVNGFHYNHVVYGFYDYVFGIVYNSRPISLLW